VSHAGWRLHIVSQYRLENDFFIYPSMACFSLMVNLPPSRDGGRYFKKIAIKKISQTEDGMLKRCILVLAAVLLFTGMSLKTAFAAGVDYKYIIDTESRYLESLVAPSGSIILGERLIYKFRGTPHYQVSPYAANFSARALLDDPTSTNLAIVKKWMVWVFNHLNSDGSIYDWYISADSLKTGVELPSVDAFPSENIKEYDSRDSYAATFLTLARKYVEIVPADTSWLRGFSTQLESIGNALYSCVDDSAHQFDSGKFSPDNNDGLTVAMPAWQAKYTMDNSETNEGLRDMIWLEQNIITHHDSAFYQKLVDDQLRGFSNLWDSAASMYYVGEGIASPNWDTFYPDASCQVYPIWAGVISPSSSRAVEVYHEFNSHFPDWQTGKNYGELWSIVCYAAMVMNDTSRVNSYLSSVQRILETGDNPPEWDNIAAAFIIRTASHASRQTAEGKNQ
jgi:hypothetical protein